MTFDYGGDGEPRGNAQLGLHHHPRVVHPPLKRRRGTLCCLSARPPDIADLTAARTEVACVQPSFVPCVYSKRAALTRAPVSFFANERFVRFSSQPLVEQPSCAEYVAAAVAPERAAATVKLLLGTDGSAAAVSLRTARSEASALGKYRAAICRTYARAETVTESSECTSMLAPRKWSGFCTVRL